MTAWAKDQSPVHDKDDPALAYANTRPPPANLATNGTISTYHMPLGLGGETRGAARHFPQPEMIWLSRDVDHDDWDTFLTQLDAAATQKPDKQMSTVMDKDVEAQDRQEVIKCISRWNRSFFAPRGLKVLPSFGDKDPSATISQLEAAQAQAGDEADQQTQTQAQSTRRGYGIKLGENSLLGLSLPPHANGFGIRIGGVLLGVSTGDAEDAGKKTGE